MGLNELLEFLLVVFVVGLHRNLIASHFNERLKDEIEELTSPCVHLGRLAWK